MSTNPFDREVRRKLKQYESPVSPDLLDKVLARRQRRFFLLNSRAVLLGLLVLAGIAGWWYGLSPNESTDSSQEERTARGPLAFVEKQNSVGLAEAELEEISPSLERANLRASATGGKDEKHGMAQTKKQKRIERKQGILPSDDPLSQAEEVASRYLPARLKKKPGEVLKLTDEKIPEGQGVEVEREPSDEEARGKAESIFLPTALLRELPKDLRPLSAGIPLAPGPRCADFEQGAWRLFFDLTASPDFALRSIRPKDEQSLPLALKRLETESAKQSYSLGSIFSLVSPHGWSFRTGFEYTQINERFAYQGDVEERVIIEVIYNDQGQIIGTDTTYESYAPYYASNNLYRLFDIPLLVGYQLDLKKFALTFHGGTYVNLFLAPEGRFFSPELQPVSFEEVPAFRKRASLSLAAAFGINYRLSSRLNLVFEPKFRYFFGPITTKDYLLEQQYMVVGLNLGARLRL